MQPYYNEHLNGWVTAPPKRAVQVQSAKKEGMNRLDKGAKKCSFMPAPRVERGIAACLPTM